MKERILILLIISIFISSCKNEKKEALEKEGMIISGQSNGLIEAVELKDHPWFVGVQFHPEFTSHLETPNPIILEFVKQATKRK